MAYLKCLGIMNGTSLDGADFVLVEVNSQSFNCRYIKMQSFKFSKHMRLQLLKAAKHELKVDQLALLHHELGHYYADCFKKLSADMKKVDVIGLHGQTVFHRGGKATLQIGESSYLAAASSGAPVVCDFRVADIAVGGQGAPLASFFHERVFGKKNKTISVHNLGGISNISLIVNSRLKLAFDTGPGNMLLDMAIQRATSGRKLYDQNGKSAERGEADLKLVRQMLKHKFFKKSPPKSCGREEFGESFYNTYSSALQKLTLNNRLATLTEFVAESIVQAYEDFVLKTPEEIIFCGGGARNTFLLQKIAEKMPEVKIKTTESLGWPEQSIEGAAFALMAAAKILNIDSNIPLTTGAKRPISLGKIVQV